MQKTIIKHIFSLLSVLFLIAAGSCTQDTTVKHILLIQSYEANYPAYEKIKKILSEQLEDSHIQAEVRIFHLNCEQYTEKARKLRIHSKLDMLSGWKPDVIIVEEDQAMNALLSCRHPLVDSIPVVFTGINYPDIPLIKKHPNFTGFQDKPDYRTNIKLIERLIGKCIVVRISDDTLLDKLILEDMDNQVKGLCASNSFFSPDRVRLSGKNGISLSKIKKVYPDSTYISTLSTRSNRSLIKGFGENYYNKAYLATKRNYSTITLGRLSAFPSFSAIYEMIGYNNGVVGGYVTTFEEQGRNAAKRVKEILQGTPVTNFPQITESAKDYIFDYKVLEEWKIDRNRLPRNATFMHMPFYIKYEPYLLFSFIILGTFILFFIIYQRIQYKKESLRKKEAQQKLKQEKEFLSFALDSGNIYTFRYKNGIFEFDKEFYHFLGLPEAPITADEFQEAIHPDEQADFILNRHMLDSGFPSRQILRRRYDFNKKGYQWWEFRYAQNTNAHASDFDNTVEVNGLCLNIQQIKETEINLIQARKKAEESDHMKSVFLANMSHEIRTPLNAIVGFSQLLSNESYLEQEEKDEFIGIISKNSDLLLKLINDILDLSRIESGRLSFSFEDCNLSDLVDDIYQTHQLLMPPGVELRKQVPDVPAIIRTDRHRLTQVFTNFINNATKFTTAGYIQIQYEYSADRRSILISVTDTGKGIPEDKKKLVFERFQKLDEFAQGTGLGLAICQSIIKVFKGSITLESEVGKGSKFIISLPYDPEKEA